MSKKFTEGANPMNLKWTRWKTVLTCAFLLLSIVLCDTRAASALPTGKVMAIPAFARKYGLPCSACHTAWPELNNFGQVFRDNGYQLMNDRDSPIWQNPSYFPIAFRITPNWHRESTTQQTFSTGTGTLTQAGWDLSGMDLWSGGTLYKNISFILLPSSDPTAVWHFESAFVRFDNIKNNSWFNLKFGRFELDELTSEKRFLFLSNNGGSYQIYHFNVPGSSNDFGLGDNQIGMELFGHSSNSYTRYSASLLSSNEGGVNLTNSNLPGGSPAGRSYDGYFAFTQGFNAGSLGLQRIQAYAYVGQRPTGFVTDTSNNPLVGIDNKPFYRIGFTGDLYFHNLELLPFFMYGHDNPYLGIPGLPSTQPLPPGAQAPTFYGGFLEAHYYFNPQNVALARIEQISVGQQAFSSGTVNSSYGNVTAYSFGYRWYPMMFSRAGLAIDGEFSRVRSIGTAPLSGDGVAPPTTNDGLWSNSYFVGFDFDF
jgi:hypothetical protein